MGGRGGKGGKGKGGCQCEQLIISKPWRQVAESSEVWVGRSRVLATVEVGLSEGWKERTADSRQQTANSKQKSRECVCQCWMAVLHFWSCRARRYAHAADRWDGDRQVQQVRTAAREAFRPLD